MRRPEPSISATDLHFGYHRRLAPLFEGIALDFFPGEVVAITGRSGTGKSTLLYLLALLLQPGGGTVRWHGRSVATLPDGERSRLRAVESGFIFQDAMLDPSRTVLENVCEPAIFAGMRHAAARHRAAELLDKFGLAHRAEHRPGEVSGGQAQRVGLCRALLRSPRLLFGDEPTGNLDAETAELVWQELVAQSRAGATVLIATHDPKLVARADSVVELG